MQRISFSFAMATVILLMACCYGIAMAARNNRNCDNIRADDENGESVICGRVTFVNDGDTLRLSPDGRRNSASLRIRLLEIDAPELNQRHGAEARDALRYMAPTGSRVCILVDNEDIYGRLLGRVCRGGADLNLRLLEDGHVWCYRGRCRSAYRTAELQARSSRRGLWSDPTAQAPWLFRKQKG
ncbi:hypothetical protein BOX15_Mlig018861g1 [Macrostomum lignano]|uniref:TNase-like domain-containing protein n=1 Tax=Macrostomum lignano TaxID=282301 RepID=A0A267GYL3_9PLAT|nr:hypothetical protein BOX15_Mlig018861g1 [Macrostomum lignano]